MSYTWIAEEPGRIFILDEQLDVVGQSELLDPGSSVIAWLPDDSGVLIESGPPRVFDLEEDLFRLPFEADRVIAVVP